MEIKISGYAFLFKRVDNHHVKYRSATSGWMVAHIGQFAGMPDVYTQLLKLVNKK